MNSNEVLKDVAKQINMNRIRKVNYSWAVNKLKDLLEVEPDNIEIYNLLGKVYYLMGDYNQSISYYKDANMIKFNKLSYLGQYKTYAYMGKFVMARDAFNKYKSEVKGEAKENSSFELIDSALLAIVSRMEQFKPVKDRETFMYQKMIQNSLENTYDQLIDSYNEKDFYRASELARKLERIAIDQNIYVEFGTLSVLLDKLCVLVNQKEDVFSQASKLIDEEKTNNVYSLFLQLLKEPGRNYKTIRKIITYLVEHDLYDDIIDQMQDRYAYTSGREYIKDYIKYAKDIHSYYAMEEDVKRVYEYALLKGDYLKTKKEYDDAFDIYEYGYYITNHSIFVYYMARCLYLKEEYISALKYLQEYLHLGGGLKKEECMHQIANISPRRKRPNRPKGDIKVIQEKKFECDDPYKARAQKELVFTVEDFLKR